MLAGMNMLAAVAAEAANGAAKPGLPQLDVNFYAPQLFWLALTFAALYFLMSKVALPKIGDVVAERAGRIQRDIEAAAKLKGETDKALADYEKALQDARGKASAMAKETRETLTRETEAEKTKVEGKLAAAVEMLVKAAEGRELIVDSEQML